MIPPNRSQIGNSSPKNSLYLSIKQPDRIVVIETPRFATRTQLFLTIQRIVKLADGDNLRVLREYLQLVELTGPGKRQTFSKP